MGEPSARTFGQRVIDLNVAAAPSEIEAGLFQGRCELGVHTPVRSQCADAADAAGTQRLKIASVTQPTSSERQRLE
jgi:hypothetical protein